MFTELGFIIFKKKKKLERDKWWDLILYVYGWYLSYTTI